MDFSVTDAAGLSYAEAAQIFDVSDVTVFKYKRKGATPRPTVRRRVEIALHTLHHLVEKGQLPKPDLPKGSKDPEIQARRKALIDKITAHVEAKVAA